MRKIKYTRILSLLLLVLALALSRGNALAQQPMGGMNMNMDPQQMQQQIQQRLMEYMREQLVVTNDDEWSVIQTRLSKVLQNRMEGMAGGMGAFRGMMGNRGGGGGGGGRGFGALGQPSPEADALQKAIDSNAPPEQLASAVARLREVRKRKQAELAAAQEQLRAVLTPRQEAVLVSMSMLE
jgi:hypothetical protein